ncbi:MAG: hypothetical protein R3F59_24340 [Myxococcota bacterium]
MPLQGPPGVPKVQRGSRVTVDLAGAVGAEARGTVEAVVVSNDDRQLLRPHLPGRAPRRCRRQCLPVAVGSDTVDVGRLRIVDVERLQGAAGPPLDPSVLAPLDAALAALVPGSPVAPKATAAQEMHVDRGWRHRAPPSAPS